MMKEQIYFERTLEEETFCDDRALHLLNDQKQPGLGIHLHLSRGARHGEGFLRKEVTGHAILSVSGSRL